MYRVEVWGNATWTLAQLAALAQEGRLTQDMTLIDNQTGRTFPAREHPFLAARLPGYVPAPAPPPAGFETAPIDGNPFLTIWFQPRSTMRSLMNAEPIAINIGLMALWAIDYAMGRALDQAYADRIPLAMIWGIAIVMSPITSVTMLYPWSWLLGLTGRLLGGSATYADLRTAIAWGSLPLGAMVPVWLLVSLTVGAPLFSNHLPGHGSDSVGLTLILLALLWLIASIWCTILTNKCIAEAQGYRSAWLAVLNGILVGLALVIPLMLIGLLLVPVLNS